MRKGRDRSRPSPCFVDAELLLARRFPRLADGDCLGHVTHLEAGEALHRDVLAQLADHRGDQLRHRHGLVLDEGLLVEADLLVEFAHLALDDLLDHRSRLAGLRRLRAIDVLLLLERFGSDIFLADKARIGRGHVHGDVMHQVLEVIGAGDKVAFAVDLDQHADLAAGVDVAGHRAFAGGARRLLGRGGNALLAENDDGLLDIALGFREGVLAVHHGSVGLVAKLFHLCCGYVHGSSAHVSLAIRLTLFAFRQSGTEPSMMTGPRFRDRTSRLWRRANGEQRIAFLKQRPRSINARAGKPLVNPNYAVVFSARRPPRPNTSSMLTSSESSIVDCGTASPSVASGLAAAASAASLYCTPAEMSAICLSVAAFAPSTTESAIFDANSRIARSASSLPGIT